MTRPTDPDGDMVPILRASVEEAKMRHPSGSEKSQGVLLVATDRCDACPAAAAYRVMHRSPPDWRVLDFCVHHWKKNFPRMVDQGWVVVGGNPDTMGDHP